ncbi:Stomatin/HflK/HflC family like protein [Aduncisulcus paluster]|uniref:Stomatin/HflK/HflC family like protein n=1 Tax=Aduncisulcus paluster TaxID=2918883 RepID=A0ABQ5K9L9_9EUKA|nr:Stomatin/HflK/HflC family like protein [Aduncisulcus paluster]|eukprot:gnl/Carplike_NY0171/938_a1289_1749.p1 GENE.gnl/Carplike_NY0171/938_a1289_1749~~gnl/Carplike_NY0171/938_a1289_1749.p1  ORF type:complete len:352 (-),score=90.69 gnl/Carplike_NY0171/938_a1289_1749:85-1140(-)
MPIWLIILIVVLGLLFLTFLFFEICAVVVHSSEAIVIERFGKYHRILEPGLHFLIPFYESPRQFSWVKTYLDEKGVPREQTINSHIIDLRESIFNLMRQETQTKEGVFVSINACMAVTITDVKKAIYECDDILNALSNTAQTFFKEVFGQMTFQDALSSQEELNESHLDSFRRTVRDYGVTIHRVDILEFSPRRELTQTLKKQMMAERTRRGEFIRSEGEKTAKNLRAEGIKIQRMTLGRAEQEATRKRSEGLAAAKIALAKAERSALERISSTVAADSISHSDYTISQKYMDLIRLGMAKTKKLEIQLPYVLGGLTGIIDGLSGSFGAVACKDTIPPVDKVAEDDFDDLS